MVGWRKSQHVKFQETMKRKASAKRGRAASSVAGTLPPVDAHYVGETAQAQAVDVNRLEERAFRRGMFTAFQMIIDLFLRELR